MYPLLSQCNISRGANAAAAGTTDVDSAVLDMADFDAALCIADLGDVTNGCVLDLEAYGSNAANGSSPTKLDGVGAVAADATSADNKVLVLDVVRPAAFRYLFFRLKRGTANAVVDALNVIRYRPRSAPVTQGSTVFGSKIAVVG